MKKIYFSILLLSSFTCLVLTGKILIEGYTQKNDTQELIVEFVSSDKYEVIYDNSGTLQQITTSGKHQILISKINGNWKTSFIISKLVTSDVPVFIR